MQLTSFWLFTPANVLLSVALAVLAGSLLRVQGAVWQPVAVLAIGLVLWTW
jgi:hypothetical protein